MSNPLRKDIIERAALCWGANHCDLPITPSDVACVMRHGRAVRIRHIWYRPGKECDVRVWDTVYRLALRLTQATADVTGSTVGLYHGNDLIDCRSPANPQV